MSSGGEVTGETLLWTPRRLSDVAQFPGVGIAEPVDDSEPFRGGHRYLLTQIATSDSPIGNTLQPTATANTAKAQAEQARCYYRAEDAGPDAPPSADPEPETQTQGEADRDENRYDREPLGVQHFFDGNLRSRAGCRHCRLRMNEDTERRS